MSDSSNNSPSTDDFDMSRFLSDNSELILVMGTFAAISVYLGRIPQVTEGTSFIIGVGVVTSLLISVIVGAQIVYNQT